MFHLYIKPFEGCYQCKMSLKIHDVPIDFHSRQENDPSVSFHSGEPFSPRRMLTKVSREGVQEMNRKRAETKQNTKSTTELNKNRK
ncbi:hypothetical protein CEXT_384731 [Caerostris extrusa]|uniref:Uncharacterized protein n=1 Tax=Caerostris extrusa TaxID=172846 RepID=A0AAV4RUJ0_CAEEX|nr:hypothetical protein CEXT_384731 [Caerostris extrusa]